MVKPEVKGCFVLGFFDLLSVQLHIIVEVELCEFVFMFEVHTGKNSLKSTFSILVSIHSLLNIQY